MGQTPENMIAGIKPDEATGKARAEVVRRFLFDRGATLVGFAPASAFAGAPAGHRATDIIPQAKSVIVMGLKLISSLVDWPSLAWKDDREVVFNAWMAYDEGCFDSPNMRLSHMAAELAIAFEVNGFQAFFAPPSHGTTITGLNAGRLYGHMAYPQPLDREKLARLAPDVEAPSRYGAPFSVRHAAVAAGLATFGASNLVLHPVFGPRVRWSAVITELEMDRYDQPLTEPVCLYDKGCRACIETCPYDVFEEVTRFEFAGHKHPWSAMTGGKCYYNSAPCGGMCIQTCPAGTGDKAMKKAVARRFRPQRGASDQPPAPHGDCPARIN